VTFHAVQRQSESELQNRRFVALFLYRAFYCVLIWISAFTAVVSSVMRRQISEHQILGNRSRSSKLICSVAAF
jgi:hypothetical protein